MNNKALSYFIIGTFVTLYIIVSLISTIHVIEFFKLSNPEWLAISLAVAFEIGAAASLASLIALKKMNKSLVWALFIVLTCMQMMGNAYYAFTNLHDFQGWVDLFGLTDEDPLYQKRILSIISGAVLPLVAIGFIKSLVDYIKPSENEDSSSIREMPTLPFIEEETSEEVKNDTVIKEEPELNEEPAFNEVEEAPEKESPEEALHSEDEKKKILESAIAGELTKNDIETYREKSRIPPSREDRFMNPQIAPGLNM